MRNTDKQQLLARIAEVTRDERVLAAFAAVPRDEFVPPAQRAVAWVDRALPLSEGQTISQPSMIAIMLDALACEPNDTAIEVGAGCGYAAALLAQLVRRVHAIEIRPTLAESARTNLARCGIDNVSVYCGDGSAGLPEAGRVQRILVSAGAESVPPRLLAQLAPGGRIAIPVGASNQTLKIAERLDDGSLEWRDSIPCLFVPLVSA